MVNFWSISMLLVLLETVNRADFWRILMFLVLLKQVSRAEFKYVCIVWIRNQIREIFTTDS